MKRFIRYLGSKAKMLPVIHEVAEALDVRSICDAFAGSGRVGHSFKAQGYNVESNDFGAAQYAINEALIRTNLEEVGNVPAFLQVLNALPGKLGWFTKTYCQDARFWRVENGMKVDAIRDEIELWNREKRITNQEYFVLLYSLILALDQCDATMGMHKAYLKSPSSKSRFHTTLELEMPDILPNYGNGKHYVWQDYAENVVHCTRSEMTYIDPPYTVDQYSALYHVWDSLVIWDKPPVYGVARKRIDCKDSESKSPFCSKVKAPAAMRNLIGRCCSRYIVLSYSTDAIIPTEEIKGWLREARGEVIVIEKAHDRYSGYSQGGHANKGPKRRVSKPTAAKNTERLYVAGSFTDAQRAALLAVKGKYQGHAPTFEEHHPKKRYS